MSTETNQVNCPWPFPPYGEMTEGLQKALAAAPGAPADFPAGQDWNKFVDDVANEIAGTLWPKWDNTTQGWLDADRKQMEALTQFDLDLLRKLRAVHLEAPALPNGVANVPQHSAFYSSEDTQGFLDMYTSYDKDATPAAVYLMKAALEAGRRKYGTIPQQFKLKFQRPR
jgi:hypothetical protein